MTTDAATERRAVAASRGGAYDLVGVGLAVLAALLAVAGLAQLVTATAAATPVAGVTMATLQGGALIVLGVGILGCGVASATGAASTTPDHTGGLLGAVLLGLAWLVATGLVVVQTVGGPALWLLAGLAAGAVVGAAVLFTREDVGTTLSAGTLLALAGAAIVGGVVGPDWTWAPDALGATFTADVAIPIVAIGGGLVGGWTAARAQGRFGPRGRQRGAYVLIGANAAAMVALLAAVVLLIASKGFAPMTEGIRIGLFWRPLTWFHLPVLDRYVIFHGPVLWFYWPFVMEGASAVGGGPNGILPAVVGTLWVVLGAVLFAVPLGVGAAVFLTEYAEQGRLTAVTEIATNGLWSTPSIVYGLFGLAFLVPRLGNQTSILSGQLVLGFMLLPLVIITSRESLKSVPDEYRDASAALGVGKWQTIRSVVLPAAMPGVITGVILGVGRIAGETAPILLVLTSDPFPSEVPHVITGSFAFTSGFPFVRVPTIDLIQSSSALPYQLYAIISAGLGGGDDFAWGTALVLLLVVMTLYGVGVVSRIYFRRKLDR